MTEQFDFDFSFGDDELKQPEREYVPMPRGWYTAELQEDGLGVEETQSGDKVFRATFSEIQTLSGERYLEGVGGIGGRKVDWSVWLTYEGEAKPGSVAKAFVSLARAFGFAVQNGDGKWTLSQFQVGDPQEYAADIGRLATEFADDLSGYVGSRCQIEVTTKRTVKGERTYVDEKVRQVKEL